VNRAVDRGVSPVLGSAVLVVIAVVILAVIALAVLSGAPDVRDPPPAQFGACYDASAGEITVTHVSGRPLAGSRVFVEDDDGGSANWSALHPNGSEAIEGTSITFDGTDGASSAAGAADAALKPVGGRSPDYPYYVRYVDRNGEETTLLTYRLPDRSTC
jgi:FlaG/FlaF family flagellin (archaellin)